MIPIIYESSETGFASNGLGRLRDCINCVVTEERNGIYECDFDYPIDGANFDLIQCGRIIGVRHDDSDDIQPFDIVSYSKPISGIVSFHAVHVSYRQSYLTIFGKNINSLAAAFTRLGASVPQNPFAYSTDIPGTGYVAAFDGEPRTVRQMLGGVEGSILDTFGGEYEFDKFKVILHKSRGVLRDFSIRYGVNLIDYKDETDYSGTYSAVIPYWKGNVNGVEKIVTATVTDSGTPTYNNRTACVPMDLSDKFEDMPTAADLQSMALALMHSRQTTLPATTISVDFVRLQDLGFDDYADLLQCNLCDTVKVVFPRYGMKGRYKIVKTEYDVLAGRYIGMELGSLSVSLAEALGVNSQSSLNHLAGLTLVYKDYDFTITYTAGTVGTRGAQLSTDIALSGCVPISATVLQQSTSAVNPSVVFTNGLLYLNAFRANTSAVNNATVKVRVGYYSSSSSSSEHETGTNDYNALVNRPLIEGVTLQGDKTFEDLHLEGLTNTEIENLLTNAE